jgi:phenylalanyl-tRNA synthetase beta chain
MRAPLSWIRDFTPLDAPVDEIVAALNRVGLEVEGVDEPGREVVNVRVARVLEVSAHPNADRMRLAEIDDGGRTTRVVCGAPNLRAGMLVAFASVGATLPGGITLERKKLRGEVSDGMLCSPAELGLGDDQAGILDLDPDLTPGTDIREVLGLDDVIFDLAITPNRPDAMCVVGVARELAAQFQLPLHVPTPAAPGSDFERTVGVVLEAPDRCPRYLARVAAVTMGESPAWMRQRLVKAGMRPISNVVDVTNYVLLERNQPLHAFDLDRLAGPGIVVRLAEAGETITTLDGVERALDAQDLLICDAARAPQAIAGIMGGGDSEVSDTTTAILLESAYFERMGIARSSKRLKLRSEASARFERGTDPDGVAAGAERALELLAEVAAARVDPHPVDQYPRPATRPRIRLRTSRVNAILGTALSDRAVLDALRPLQIDVEGAGDDIVAIPPTFRPDLDREIDLIEEVARRTGFDAIGRSVARPDEQIGALSHRQRDRRLVTDALVGAGGSEAVTVPLVAPDALGPFDAGPAVELANPLRADESLLRTVLLPGLLTVAAANAARGRPDLALFEIGTVFGTPPPDEVHPTERLHLAGILTGTVPRRPLESDRPIDVHDAVDWLRAVLDALEIATWTLEPAPVPGYHPTRAARLLTDGRETGTIGELAPATLTRAGAATPTVAFEVDLETLWGATRRDRSFQALSPFPPSTIDLAFVVRDEIPAAALAQTLRDAAGGVLETVRPFDEYRGEQLGDGMKSVAFMLVFRAPDHTLTDAEVADLRRECVDAVAAAHQATLRE